mmetsp:Transcript_46764/g.82446  ORF Transcript_46764/g.82446 Transcript_46764/m.82446 type:complete len:216 (-) Transcript_46764:61-708(-)
MTVKRMSSLPSMAPSEQAQKDEATVTVRRMFSLPSNSPRDRQANVLAAEVAVRGFSTKSMCASHEDLLKVNSSVRPVHFLPSPRDASPTRHPSPAVTQVRLASPPAGKNRYASSPVVHCPPSTLQHLQGIIRQVTNQDVASPRPHAKLLAVPSASSLRVSGEASSVLPVTPRQTTIPKLNASPSIRLFAATKPVAAPTQHSFGILTPSESSNVSL